MSDASTDSASMPRRMIKRYSNRKLYDTKDSRYVTLQQIGEFVRQGEDVQIIDNKTKEDKTEVTLALILSEDLKNKPSSVPLGTLRHLIQERGERILSQLRDGPIGRFIPNEENGGLVEGVAPQAVAEASEAVGDDRSPAKARFEELKKSMDDFQTSLDERLKMLVPGQSVVRDLQNDIASLKTRVDELESKIAKLEK